MINYLLIPNKDFVPIPLFDTEDDIYFVLNKDKYLPEIHEREFDMFSLYVILFKLSTSFILHVLHSIIIFKIFR